MPDLVLTGIPAKLEKVTGIKYKACWKVIGCHIMQSLPYAHKWDEA